TLIYKNHKLYILMIPYSMLRIERMNIMIEKSVVVSLESGLQARPAAQFVQEANRFKSDLFLEKNDKRINAKSIMGLMSLAITKDTTVKLIADGSDAEDAIETLTRFVTRSEERRVGKESRSRGALDEYEEKTLVNKDGLGSRRMSGSRVIMIRTE